MLQIITLLVPTPVILVKFPRIWEDGQLGLASLCMSEGSTRLGLFLKYFEGVLWWPGLHYQVI